MFYVYAYLRSNESITAKIGTPYYIGKGIGNRAFTTHSSPVPKDKSCIIFIKENLTEQEAHSLEIALISKYGRKDLGTGILHNRTNGGEGISNPSVATREKLAYAKRNESAETRLKRSIAAKNRIRAPLSEETKQKISEANKGKVRTEKTKELMSALKKGKPLSTEHKEKISISVKGKIVTIAQRKKISESLVGRKHSADHILKNSESKKDIPWSKARREAQNLKNKRK